MLSVVMAVYNETASEIQQSINSILNQSYENFEFLIVLDNPDNVETCQLLNLYAMQDNRIILIKNKVNIGLGSSLDKAIKQTHSEFIVRMDADDIADRERLAKIKNSFNKNIDLIFSKYEVVNAQGVHIKYSAPVNYTSRQIKKKLFLNNFICHPSVAFRKKAYFASGGYSDIRVSEDIDLWIRMIKKGYVFKGINDSLVKYRIRNNSMTTSNYYRTHFAKKFIRKQYKKWNGVDKVSNEDFYVEFNKSKHSLDKYNSDAKELESIIKNWRNERLKGFGKAVIITVKHPLIFSIMFDRLLSAFIRPKGSES